MSFRICFCIVVAALLGGCAPKAPNIAAGAAIAGGVPLTPEHTLSPNDEIEIRFAYAPEFNDKATIGQDGHVSLKLVGGVLLGGATVPEATQRLKERFAKIVRHPELSVTVRTYAPQAVYVDGWVARPGLIRSEAPLTVARAIARAGGVKKDAKTGAILLLRRDSDGKLHSSEVALGDYGGAAGQDPLLKSFDVVYVPQTAIAAVGEFLATYTKNLPFSASYDVIRAPPSITTQIINTPTGTPR